MKNKLINDAMMEMIMKDDINEIHVLVGKMFLTPQLVRATINIPKQPLPITGKNVYHF